ncbi:MAG: orotate phosphoribosyltransferase [Flavobacteriales bacterium]|nr:orotate phosphoribosyltransferase [Flavobacteriales bacterium]
MNQTETSSKIAQYLLKAKAVKLSPDSPFTWASGWRSPIYCDNRITLSFPEIRTYIKQQMASAISENFKDADVLVGVATAGIAIGALVADELGLPYAYARPKPKEHGLKNQIEGRIVQGQKIVVIEDLISTGGSSLKVVKHLRDQEYDVLGMSAIFTYGFEEATHNFEKADCSLITLSNYNALINEALKMGDIDQNSLKRLSSWRESPSSWE